MHHHSQYQKAFYCALSSKDLWLHWCHIPCLCPLSLLGLITVQGLTMRLASVPALFISAIFDSTTPFRDTVIKNKAVGCLGLVMTWTRDKGQCPCRCISDWLWATCQYISASGTGLWLLFSTMITMQKVQKIPFEEKGEQFIVFKMMVLIFNHCACLV